MTQFVVYATRTFWSAETTIEGLGFLQQAADLPHQVDVRCSQPKRGEDFSGWTAGSGTASVGSEFRQRGAREWTEAHS
jgi:hypothetical protein